MEGTTLLQNRRKYLANDLTILRTIQEYQSRDRLRLAREAIGLTDKMRVAALKETTEADDNMNKVIQAEQVRRIPRPTIPSDSVSQPLGPEMDGRHVFLLEGKLAARQHKEYDYCTTFAADQVHFSTGINASCFNGTIYRCTTNLTKTTS
jgi:hypothetical protein